MFESKFGILFVGGLGFFAFAFLSNGLVPMLMYQDMPEKTALEVVNSNVTYLFEDLSRRYPTSFTAYYDLAPVRVRLRRYDTDGDGLVSREELPGGLRPVIELADRDGDDGLDEAELEQAALAIRCAEALQLGRQVYIGEGCWHCHSQFVRPVSNESLRWGEVAQTEEYQNELQRPVMFGTRRVGPDLSREGGRRSNDWHTVHFFRPKTVSTGFPMPEYPWFFDGDPDQPNQRGLAIITYVQWLGSWLDSYPYYEELAEIEAASEDYEATRE